MELAALLSQQIHVLENLLACLEREKAALIKEDAKTLLDIIEEKKTIWACWIRWRKSGKKSIPA